MSAIRLNSAAFWSTKARVSRPLVFAFSAFVVAFSSVPVKKKTSRPRWRWKRARASVAAIS